MAQKFISLTSLPSIFSAVKTYVDNSVDAIPAYQLPAATSGKIGGVKPGTGLAVAADGTISVTGDATVNSVEWAAVKNAPKASKTAVGLVKVGDNITVTPDGTITVAAPVTKTSQLSNDSGFVTTSAMNSAIAAAKSELIGGAPETYDTLKEIADYISDHKNVETAINTAIGKKSDKEYVDSTFIKTSDMSEVSDIEILSAAAEVFEAVK